MCIFALIVKLISFTSIMVAATIARLKFLTMRFKNYKKSPCVSMRENLRHMSNMISDLAKMGYELTDAQQVHTMIHSLPNDRGHIKMVVSQATHTFTFEDIRQQLELEKEWKEVAEVTSVEVHMSTSN